MIRARAYLLLALLALLALPLAAACSGDDDSSDSATATAPASTATSAATAAPTKIGGNMILATTTSTQDSGLLDVLVPMFKDQTGIEVKVIAVGTGAALEMGAKGDADGVLVHAPASEKKYVDSGDLVDGQLVMHNDFVLVGPPNDPAGVSKAANINDAMKAIGEKSTFISRGDDSGTNKKELELWQAAGVSLDTAKREETGQGMGATLNIANQRRAYTLTDRATYLALKKNLELNIVFDGDKSLLNIYSVYVVNPAKHSGVKEAQARAFVDFMVAPETQQAIANFKKAEYGESLFTPDAGKSVEQLGR